MNLNVSNWKSFRVGKLFTMLNGKGITQEEIAENEGDFIAVQSAEENNGVMGKINLNYCKQMKYTYTEKPCLTVARSGSAGFVSFQIHGCVVGDSAKILLLPDEVASTEVYTFLQSVLTANRFKYTYGRKVTEDKYLNDLIDLPILYNSDGTPYVDDDKTYSEKGYVPDWQFMKDYIESLHHKPITTKNKPDQTMSFDVQTWGTFLIKDLFIVELSKGDIKLDDIEAGTVPLVSSGETDNGIVGYIDSEGDGKADIFPFNRITLDMFGNAFYQNAQFYSVSHGRVNILNPRFELSKYIALFITTVINQEKYKFSYGRAVYSGVAEEMEINLPIKHNTDGTPYIDKTKKYSKKGYVPDWQFMENYIKALPYADRL